MRKTDKVFTSTPAAEQDETKFRFFWNGPPVCNQYLIKTTNSENSYFLIVILLHTMALFLNFSLNSFQGLKPATSCVRDQDATTVPAIHM